MVNLPISRKYQRSCIYLVSFVLIVVIYRTVLLYQFDKNIEGISFILVVKKDNDKLFMNDTFQVLEKRTSHSMVEEYGKLNAHIWYEICGTSLDSLRKHWLFPKLPSSRTYHTVTKKVRTNSNYGERIFGYIHTVNAGTYTIMASGVSYEIWLSPDHQPQDMVQHLQKHSSSGNTQNGDFKISLKENTKYYLEILHKVGKKPAVFNLKWKPPDTNNFVVFTDRDISLMYKDGHLVHGEVYPEFKVDEILTVHKKTKFPYYDAIEKPRANIHKIPLLEDKLFDNVLPKCDYSPSYILKKPVGGYKGVWETHYTSIYPSDNSNLTRFGWLSFGNDILAEEKAKKVVQQFMEAVNIVNKRNFKLKQILSVEENHDAVKGDRYLLELEVEEVIAGVVSEKSMRVSKYVYRMKGSDSLCIPDRYQWQRNTTINIVITVGGGQGRWLQHFINNMAEIYHETKDPNLNIIIMDFHSRDIDIKKSLQESGLPRYILLYSKSRFHKTMGLQSAMEYVTNPDEIIFICDLHLYLPVTIVDHIRKHCIQGKSVYSPLVRRLDCGDTPDSHFGRWEKEGYGPLATFKSDWSKFGGMNVEMFRHKWGGEDWEMATRIVSAGYEIERLKLLNFVHYFHTKKGMWNEAR